MQHQQINFKQKKDQFGAMKHTLTCHEQFTCIHPKAKTRENDYKKTKNTRSARNQKAKSDKKIKVSNSDELNLVETNSWTSIFGKIKDT